MQCGVSREGGSKSLPCLAFRLEVLETHKAQVVRVRMEDMLLRNVWAAVSSL